MAKAKLNPLFRGISGTMGDLVFKRSKTGQAIVTRCPQRSNAEPSEAQIAQRNKFRQAAAYTTAALANASARGHYEEEARRLKKTPYALAVADYFKGTNLLRDEHDLASFDPGI